MDTECGGKRKRSGDEASESSEKKGKTPPQDGTAMPLFLRDWKVDVRLAMCLSVAYCIRGSY